MNFLPYFFWIGALIALVLDIVLITKRRPRLGWLLGLLLIFVSGVLAAYPALACQSEDPIGCEWAGIGALIIGVLTILMMTVFSLLAAGITFLHGRLRRSSL